MESEEVSEGASSWRRMARSVQVGWERWESGCKPNLERPRPPQQNGHAFSLDQAFARSQSCSVNWWIGEDVGMCSRSRDEVVEHVWRVGQAMPKQLAGNIVSRRRIGCRKLRIGYERLRVVPR